MTTIDAGFLAERYAAERLSDEDREEAVSALRREQAEGRLTEDELDDRLVQARTARTRGDLAPCFADLPESRVAREDVPTPARTSAWLVMALSPFAAVILFFATGFLISGGFAWSWLWFLLIPVAGIVGVALRGGPRQ
ncbi:DUF1707 SHOCT-like domain-containing protein [Amnibacterium kyonggiense]|uniref:Uncharacterized protein DUF1707 n=1 Tax=Amnibacterium kyonggiense TaxID=595671 RepID=A0A4R7FKK7_9MICO|nr:DUF1707 domain-containing protein [Amnibacterium kyonggiense]TDS76885.1 uncharacterized protein DUF1707 [Amnibacterium kyonggiense]